MGQDPGVINRVGQSPLGAFIQSTLGARTIEELAAVAALCVVTDDAHVYLFNALDASTLLGPLPLNTAETNPVGLEVDAPGLTFYVAHNVDTITAFDAEGEVVWTVTAGAQEQFGLGLALVGGHLFNTLAHQTTAIRDTLTLQKRNAATGSVVDSAVIYQDVTAPLSVAGLGLTSVDGELFSLVQEATATGFITVTAYKHAATDLSQTASRALDTEIETGVETYHYQLGRGPSIVYAGVLDASETQINSWDALSVSDLSDVNASDFAQGTTFLNSPLVSTLDDDTEPQAAGPFPFLPIITPNRIRKYKLDTTAIRTTEALVDGHGTQQIAALARDLGALALGELVDVTVDDGAYSQQVTATAGTPTFWALLVLPSGATISASGLVEWASPVKAGSPHVFRVYAASAAGWDQIEWTVSVQDTAPIIDAIADDSHFTNFNPYLKSPTLSAGDTPVTWSLDVSPAGANIDPGSGAISWTAVDGVHDWTVRATNAKGFDTESWQTTVSTL